MHRTRLGLLSAALCCALQLGGCGASTAAEVKAHPPLDDAQARLWSDGVDLLANPDGLQDTWRVAWLQDMDALAAGSDLIVRGTITTVRAELDPDQRRRLHLVLRVGETLLDQGAGEPAGEELVLRSYEQSPGIGTIEQRRDTLPGVEVVAFVRYVQDGGGRVAHFQLVRPSQGVLSAIDRRNGKDRAHRVEIIEHTQQ